MSKSKAKKPTKSMVKMGKGALVFMPEAKHQTSVYDSALKSAAARDVPITLPKLKFMEGA